LDAYNNIDSIQTGYTDHARSLKCKSNNAGGAGSDDGDDADDNVGGDDEAGGGDSGLKPAKPEDTEDTEKKSSQKGVESAFAIWIDKHYPNVFASFDEFKKGPGIQECHGFAWPLVGLCGLDGRPLYLLRRTVELHDRGAPATTYSNP
jgi:hypothetical protein